jgi:hypothetical protein
MLEEHVRLYKACSYVLRSRKYRSIYVNVKDQRELFKPSKQHTYRDMFGVEVSVEMTMTCYGRSRSIHKCYMAWIKHPTKTGKPVSTIDIRLLMDSLINHYDG